MAIPLLTAASMAGATGGLGGLGGIASAIPGGASLGFSGYLGNLIGQGTGDLSQYMGSNEVEPKKADRSLWDSIVGSATGDDGKMLFNPMSYANDSDVQIDKAPAIGLPTLMQMTSQRQRKKQSINSPIYTNPYVNSLVNM